MTTCVLTRVQAEVSAWAQEQFGDNPSVIPKFNGVKLFEIPPFLGMVEELGEMAAPMAKRHQGREFLDEWEYKAAIRDALADLLIFACDFARRQDIVLADALGYVWDNIVKKRRQATWQEDKAKEEGYTNHCAREAKEISKQIREGSISISPLIVTRTSGLEPLSGEEAKIWEMGVTQDKTNKPRGQSAEIVSLEGWAGTLNIPTRPYDDWRSLAKAIIMKLREEAALGRNMTTTHEHLEQNTQGWEEPPEDADKKIGIQNNPYPGMEFLGNVDEHGKPIDENYNRICIIKGCKQKVHKTSSTGICPNCWNTLKPKIKGRYAESNQQDQG